MKIALYLLGIFALILLSLVLAKLSGAVLVAWTIGYFTAVAISNIDKHVFGKLLGE